MKTAYFAGGCFWCIEPIFAMQKGVKKVVAGYCGNDPREITYLEVKKGDTPFREAIKITYDEEIISFEKLLQIFVNNVDLFNKEGQFIDQGFNYTLCLYYEDATELQIIHKILDKMINKYQRTIYLSVEPFKHFVLAEANHQHLYLKNNPKYLEELVASGRNIPIASKEGSTILIDYHTPNTPVYLKELEKLLKEKGFKVILHGTDRSIMKEEGLLEEVASLDFDVIVIDLPYNQLINLFNKYDKGQNNFARSLMRLLAIKDVSIVILEPFISDELYTEQINEQLLLIKEVAVSLELGYVGFKNLYLKTPLDAAVLVSENIIVGDQA
ncbi:MAG: peptide-methionine (S)-S-oxide reductase MsrA [Bacilli bacterium]|nr:peptide-methionine (S)-S-oxide reductase MsrA [Bacilli bacterium]